MKISEAQIEKIKEIIDRNYKHLVISLLGNTVFSPLELATMQAAGIDTSNPKSYLTMVLMHNYLNVPIKDTTPKTIAAMLIQQKGQSFPQDSVLFALNQVLNMKVKDYLGTLQKDITSRVVGIMREATQKQLIKEAVPAGMRERVESLIFDPKVPVQELKQQLQDITGNGNRDWRRVALTETSNAIGVASVQKLLENNKGKNASEIYVMRSTVKDDVTCLPCRKFYGHIGEIPKVYRLSTLIGNGSNYGKKQKDWLPVVGATHPNSRTSQPLQIEKPFALAPGGTPYFIGYDKWDAWLQENLVG